MEYTSCLLLPTVSIDRIYTAYVKTYDGQFHFPGESHNMWELGCVRSGRAGITSGNEVYDCSRDELVIHPGGVFHNVWAQDGAVSILTISFTGSGLERYVPAGKFILNDAERMLVGLLEVEIVSTFDGRLPAEVAFRRENGQIIKSLLETLCLSLYRRRSETAAPATERRATLFSEIVTYLQMNTDRALTIGVICTECGVGHTVLKELFRTYTGTGVMKYYNHLRIRRAAALMAEGHTMAQVAELMHFSSQNYFSAFFRRETGKPPSRYVREDG